MGDFLSGYLERENPDKFRRYKYCKVKLCKNNEFAIIIPKKLVFDRLPARLVLVKNSALLWNNHINDLKDIVRFI